jgi:hypothetical protein
LIPLSEALPNLLKMNIFEDIKSEAIFTTLDSLKFNSCLYYATKSFVHSSKVEKLKN